MRHFLYLALLCATLIGTVSMASAQPPASLPEPAILPTSTQANSNSEIGGPKPAPEIPLDSKPSNSENQEKQAIGQDKTIEDLKKQIDLLSKSVETQQKMIQLLMKQVKEPATGGAALQKLEFQSATFDARQRQAAQRDVDLAQAIDNIVEHQDAQERYGPRVPAQLKELFLPSGNNETPLSIYGALAFGYSKIIGDTASAANGAGRPATPGAFYFGEFTPDFLIKLNDWIFLEAEIGIGADGSVSSGSFAQADFFINDWLTVIAGRFVAPIGWYNERLNNPWINKLPGDAPGSAPPLWMQVLPPMAMLGVQATGSFYLGSSPIKMEYSAYISNGLNLTPGTPGSPTISELANLENMQGTFSAISNEKAVGGRIGLWWPELGLEAGFSALYSGDYVAGGFEDAIRLWAVDFNYHKGNWDFRAEYGITYQNVSSFLPNNITRQGFLAQVAYRPRDSNIRYLENLEFVYRYSYVDFQGIDPTMLDLTTFSTPVDVPVRRQQNEIGLNYYFYPRLVLKCAYQINDEPGFHLHDNQFLTELAWGW